MFTSAKLVLSATALLLSATLGFCAHGALRPRDAAAVETVAIESPSPVETEAMAVPPAKPPLHAHLILAQAGAANDKSNEVKPTLLLKYGDEKADGKRSMAGAGQMIQFELPDATQKLRSLRIHCARYGYPQPPRENAQFMVLDEDRKTVLHTEQVPYSTFKRTAQNDWTVVRFKKEVAVPQTFWVALQFNAEATKGVYISYDTATAGEHSKVYIPNGEPQEVNTAGDWMVQAGLTPPQ